MSRNFTQNAKGLTDVRVKYICRNKVIFIIIFWREKTYLVKLTRIA